jgi:Ca-activated chloride channel homolog
MSTPSRTSGKRVNSITIAAGALVASLVHVSGAQFASGVNLVEVYASVTDARGQPLTGLVKEDFEVSEDGERQVVSAFAAGDFPLTVAVAVAVDRSFSMSGDRLAMVKSAARTFLTELRPRDEATLVAIGSTVDVVAPLSTDRASQLAAVAALDAFGTTGLHDAIVHAIDITEAGRGRRALLLLSDGDDRFSTATADDAVTRARGSDVMIYPISMGRSRPPLFVELATLTGGRSAHIRDARALHETMKSIAAELRQQYLLGYVPTRPISRSAGGWRSISVKVNHPGARVRARDGYLVK